MRVLLEALGIGVSHEGPIAHIRVIVSCPQCSAEAGDPRIRVRRRRHDPHRRCDDRCEAAGRRRSPKKSIAIRLNEASRSPYHSVQSPGGFVQIEMSGARASARVGRASTRILRSVQTGHPPLVPSGAVREPHEDARLSRTPVRVISSVEFDNSGSDRCEPCSCTRHPYSRVLGEDTTPARGLPTSIDIAASLILSETVPLVSRFTTPSLPLDCIEW